MSTSHLSEHIAASEACHVIGQQPVPCAVTRSFSLRCSLLGALMVLSMTFQAGCYRAAEQAEQAEQARQEQAASQRAIVEAAASTIEVTRRAAATSADDFARRDVLRDAAVESVAHTVMMSRDAMMIAQLMEDIPQLDDPASFLSRPCRAMVGDICVRRDLDRFFEKLRSLWLGVSDDIAVYSQWGDSLVINDHYTGALRRRLQARFGDAGHGFLFMANPVRHMGFQGIRLSLSSRWDVRSIIRGPAERGIQYGLAGAEFVPSTYPSLRIRSDFEENDREFQRFGVLYHVPPSVDSASLSYEDSEGAREIPLEPVNGREGLTWIETSRPVSDARFKDFDPRLSYYGVIAESGAPGVIVDNLGLVSGRIFFLLRIEEQQWAQQVDLRDPDVMSLWYGVNSSGMERPEFERRRSEYERQFREVLRRVREHQPDRDCLVISVATRGDAVGRGVINDDSLDLVAGVARASAGEADCAFLDAYEMVGGDESASRWYFARPQLMADDLHHFTVRGYWRFAELVEQQLMRAFIEFLHERQDRIRGGYPAYQHLAE